MHYRRWKRTGDPNVVRPVPVNAGTFKKGLVPHNKGVPQPVEDRRKQSETKKRLYRSGTLKAVSTFPAGHEPWNKGGTHTEQTRAKLKVARAKQVLAPDHGARIGQALKGRRRPPEQVAKFSGPNHYRWKGGSVRSMSKKAWRDLRQEVLDRDQHTCQVCQQTNVTLVAHHIVPYPEGPDTLDNLVAWCRRCHNLYHLHQDMKPRPDADASAK